MKKIAELYLGDSDDDPDIVCCVDQFLHGLDRFHGLYSVSAVDVQPGVSPNAAMLLTLIPVLHQRGLNVNIYVGKGSIERSLLVGKTKGSTVSHISGRTMLRAAKDVLRSCKKMTAIVTASNSPYKDGNYPSGTNWEDYIQWCITAMKKAVAAEKAGMIVASPLLQKDMAEKAMMSDSPDDGVLLAADDELLNEDVTDVAPELVVGTTAEDGSNEFENNDLTSSVVNLSDTVFVCAETDEADVPDGTFFKGFIVWCLWGHITITNDPEMKSMAFTESKVGTSYGRKTGSRKAMKEAAALSSIPIDNRRGKKQKRGIPKDDNEDDAITSWGGADDDNTAVTSFAGDTVEDDGILKQALDYLDSESLEKARQKHSMLSCLRVRDEITSLRGQVESVSRRYYHATTGTSSLLADSLLKKMEALEAKLLEREEYLSFLQNKEANRQLNVISERAAIRAGASLEDDRSRQQSSIGDLRLVEPTTAIHLTPVKQPSILPSGGVVIFASPMKSPAEAMFLIAASSAILVCVECSITPTSHKCRRCKRYVCDLCCYSHRRLEMVWWCGECFDNESVTN